MNFLSYLSHSGCGGYCDNNYGGVSTTGHGEAIAKVTLARNIVFYMEQGEEALLLC